MGYSGSIFVYVMIWWVVLFANLSTRTDDSQSISDNSDKSQPISGAMPGAPEKPGFAPRILRTTIISLIIWGIIQGLVVSDLISFREISQKMQSAFIKN